MSRSRPICGFTCGRRSTNCEANWRNLSAHSSIARNRPAMPRCLHTRICNAPSRCWWRTGCWRMWKCFCAMRPADRLPQAVELCPLGSGAVAGATLPLDRELMARRARFRCSDRKQHRRHQRPRFCSRVRQCALAAGAASEPLGGRDDSFFDPGIWLHAVCRKPTPPAAARCRKKKILICWN